MTKNCKVCEKVLGETCCTNDNGGLFCSVKCADIDEGKTKEQPKVHTIDGKQYVEVDRNVRVDDLILIVSAEETYDMYNNGDILIVSGIADNGVYSESAEYHAPGSGNREGYIADREFVVIEPIDSEEELVTASADNPDQIIELLGNLARRVTELEQRVNQSGEKFTAKQVAEIIKAIGVGAND